MVQSSGGTTSLVWLDGSPTLTEPYPTPDPNLVEPLVVAPVVVVVVDDDDVVFRHDLLCFVPRIAIGRCLTKNWRQRSSWIKFCMEVTSLDKPDIDAWSL
ncbi:hypothetical protein F3Y22_tig00111758pilonHSYRG00224 [Hibiscus syriacus]|uniref:Uncharacterized protein n=1 Tax=Hibiscus syriacus TaxID=106335 RepID=A0A6A2XFX7_HIBSY|nr:hypothetical protein F3Y22_tig00111758pilonHSYRG00224 [Hibiscus syriacus]